MNDDVFSPSQPLFSTDHDLLNPSIPSHPPLSSLLSCPPNMTSSIASETITFGPPHSQWHYHRPSKTYDLSPSSDPPGQKFTLATTHGPADTKISISPELLALIIVDMQNFFLSPRCRDHPLGLEAVEKLGQPGRGAQKVYRAWDTSKDLQRSIGRMQRNADFPQTAGRLAQLGPHRYRHIHHARQRPARLLMRPHSRQPTRTAAWAPTSATTKAASYSPAAGIADIHDSLKKQVQPEDVHCAKNRMSGLWNEEQPLWKYLEKAGEEDAVVYGG